MKECKICKKRMQDEVNPCPVCGGTEFIKLRPKNPNNNNQARPNQQGQQVNMGQGQQVNMGQQGQNQYNQTPAKPMPKKPVNVNNDMGRNNNFNANAFNGPEINTNVNMSNLGIEADSPKKKLWDKLSKKGANPQQNNTVPMNQNMHNMQNMQVNNDANINSDMNNNVNINQTNPDGMITVGAWIVLWIQLLIPIYNIIVIVKALTNKNLTNANIIKKNYIIAWLIWTVINVIVFVIASFTLTSVFAGLLMNLG